MGKLKEIRQFFKESQKRKGKYALDKKGRAIIDVGAETYGDIFSYYSLDGVGVLDSECDDFLKSRADLIPLNTDLTLKFHIKEANEKKRKEIEHAVRENYLREIDIVIKQLKQKSLFSLIMLLVGAGMFVLYFLSTIFNLHLSVLFFTEVAAWVFLWEAVDSFFLERQHLKTERLKKYRMIFAKVEVVEYENNKAMNLSPDEQRKIKIQRTKQRMVKAREEKKNKN